MAHPSTLKREAAQRMHKRSQSMETAKEIARDLGLSLRTVVRTYTLAKERWPEFQLNEADAQPATGEGVAT
jgi:hypothetical protein